MKIVRIAWVSTTDRQEKAEHLRSVSHLVKKSVNHTIGKNNINFVFDNEQDALMFSIAVNGELMTEEKQTIEFVNKFLYQSFI